MDSPGIVGPCADVCSGRRSHRPPHAGSSRSHRMAARPGSRTGSWRSSAN